MESGLEADDERACSGQCEPVSRGVLVTHAALPNGRRIRLLKTLLTSACENDCLYCGCRAGRDTRRATFQPEEFARLFLQLFQGGIVEGLFLSSGVVNGGMRTQDRLIACAEILRNRLGFRGYLHLKIMPGAEKDQVLRAMQLADRISINLEAPTRSHLAQLAPSKNFEAGLLAPLRYAEQIRRELPAQQGWRGRWPGSTTQFVVGGSDETDLEILALTAALSQNCSLTRAYFSAFTPIKNTPLEHKPATAPIRQDRLYQAFYLLRDYGFILEELPFEGEGFLPTRSDPKTVWAEVHLRDHPLEINRASREELLRVPGLGPVAVEAILSARQKNQIQRIENLAKITANARRAAPYLLFNGRSSPVQLQFGY